jgi:DnaJ-class molecular chaperone
MNADKAMSLLGLTHANRWDEKSIQKAWKRMLLKVHPDKSNLQDATRLTQEMNAAKDLLIQQLGFKAQSDQGIWQERARQAAERERQAKQAERERQRAEQERQAKLAEQAKQTARLAEQAKQAAAARAKKDLFHTLHAKRSELGPPPPDFQESIHQCIQENMSYENIRRSRQLQARRPGM